MRRFTLFVALLATLAAAASERKLLTMEDAILNRNLVPQNYEIRFSEKNPKIYEHARRGTIE